MPAPQTTPGRVTLSDGVLCIDGTPRILICASLCYFRLPAEQWRERLVQVKNSGYHCVEVYFPWNFHENDDGWDFTGRRDAAAFLDLAAEASLYVMVRPGPYIGSEWDSGGLPARLFANEIPLRCADPWFLREVRRWYGQIMPIIASRQYGRGGTVIAVQLENELDFFDCPDPLDYISALRDIANAHDITVPLVACAGQGDLHGATGDTAGVVATCNFYPDDSSVPVESLAEFYAKYLAALQLPLLVTKTNRAHITLRRLLSVGARLIGPYLQGSGTDYDFSGVVGPSGDRRHGHVEAQRLCALIDTFGVALGAGEPCPANGVTATFAAPEGGFRAVALFGGGRLVAVPNLSGEDGVATLALPTGRTASAPVAAGHCPFLPVDVPLSAWGLPGTLRFAGGELTSVSRHRSTVTLRFLVDGPASAFVDIPDARPQIRYVLHRGDLVELTLDPEQAARTVLPDGRVLQFATTTRAAEPPKASRSVAVQEAHVIPGSVLDADAAGHEVPVALTGFGGALERHGVPRGFGLYTADATAPVNPQPRVSGVAVCGADVLSVWLDETYLGTAVPGGGWSRLPAATCRPRELAVRAEIWRHTDFDDHRLPALRLGALRGMEDLILVTADDSIRHGWRLRGASEGLPPAVGFGGWVCSSPTVLTYIRYLSFHQSTDAALMVFDRLDTELRVLVEGREGDVIVTPLQPTVDLGPVEPGTCPRVEVTLLHQAHRTAGQPRLIQGYRPSAVHLRPITECAVLIDSHTTRIGTDQSLPITIHSGQTCWVRIDTSVLRDGNWRISCGGVHVKITALVGNEVVGRLWLPGARRPTLTGGSPDSFWLPSTWLRGGNDLALLLEGVDPDLSGRLDSVTAREE